VVGANVRRLSTTPRSWAEVLVRRGEMFQALFAAGGNPNKHPVRMGAMRLQVGARLIALSRAG